MQKNLSTKTQKQLRTTVSGKYVHLISVVFICTSPENCISFTQKREGGNKTRLS